MNEKHTGSQAPTMTLADVLYIAFRHKWKIAIISGVGVLCALCLFLLTPSYYQSEAKLFVKYVVETKTPGQVGMKDPRVTSDEGANAINTEVEILTSLDLAQQVADLVGPENILRKEGGGTDRYAAAALIRKRLVPDASPGSKVIRVTFKHRNPAIVTEVLDKFIHAYLKKHETIHLDVGVFDDFLTRQTDLLRSGLATTENELKMAKTNAQIISLEDSKKAFTEQISKVEQEIRTAEADLAERQATAEEIAKLLHTNLQSTTNQTALTNDLAISSEKISQYKKACKLLDGLRKKEQDLLLQFTPENSWVKQVQQQIEENEKIKDQLESANPGLASVQTTESREPGAAPDAMRISLLTESAKAKALQSRIRVLVDQLAKIEKKARSIEDVEGSITDLQRKKNLQEKNYEYFAANLEQSKIDQALSAGRAYNINIIQEPSHAGPAPNPSSTKIMAGILIGSIAVALGLAYLLEFYVDKTIKRPIEIESRLRIPLLLSIPFFRPNGKTKLLSHGRKELGSGPETPEPSAPTTASASNGTDAHPEAVRHGSSLAPWDILRPFCDALRDGLITFFELNNLTHKPKLVAVTSCSKQAGVSTIAAGLAASLSETGDGNVLLVDMNLRNGAVHNYYKGHLGCGLDQALEIKTRDQALVQDNLYVATEASAGDSLPVVMPKRFKNLVPRLRASDYDYIIFDMPAINQISSTQRLARFMDMVLLVVESEKTDRDVASRVSSLLRDSKTNVGAILNKTRSYIPRQLHQEL